MLPPHSFFRLPTISTIESSRLKCGVTARVASSSLPTQAMIGLGGMAPLRDSL